ncbi:MAG: hypothetical protein HC906_09320 [Bacteroidales bacterium]|nr:hypothetical protein [Bacteroidales bacterium]
MKQVHVECLPDELLVSKLGFIRKFVIHHQGKSRVFHSLCKGTSQLAMVDEDPGTVKTSYEKKLKFIDESEGIKLFMDKSDNKTIFLSGKLEDWIISVCKRYKIKPGSYSLPEDSDDLHEIINQGLTKFGNLLDDLIHQKSGFTEIERMVKVNILKNHIN